MGPVELCCGLFVMQFEQELFPLDPSFPPATYQLLLMRYEVHFQTQTLQTIYSHNQLSLSEFFVASRE